MSSWVSSFTYSLKVMGLIHQQKWLDSLTMEKSIVSSEKNFTLDLMFFSRSLISIKYRRWPRTDPCGTPELTREWSANEPLRTTRCFLFLKYLSNNLNKMPDTPFCLSLKTRLSCHTLSKDLEISKKIALTSKHGDASKDL